MGRGLIKGQGRQTDGQNSVDFNIDLHMPFNVENMFAIIKETASSNRQILCLIDSSAWWINESLNMGRVPPAISTNSKTGYILSLSAFLAMCQCTIWCTIYTVKVYIPTYDELHKYKENINCSKTRIPHT